MKEATLGFDVTAGVFGPAIEFRHYLTVLVAVDAIYLTAGFQIFPSVIEE